MGAPVLGHEDDGDHGVAVGAVLDVPLTQLGTEAARGQLEPAGVPPIGLFRTFVCNLPMAQAMGGWGSYELDRRLSLTMRDREIVIDRTCARTPRFADVI